MLCGIKGRDACPPCGGQACAEPTGRRETGGTPARLAAVELLPAWRDFPKNTGEAFPIRRPRPAANKRRTSEPGPIVFPDPNAKARRRNTAHSVLCPPSLPRSPTLRLRACAAPPSLPLTLTLIPHTRYFTLLGGGAGKGVGGQAGLPFIPLLAHRRAVLRRLQLPLHR